MAVDRDGGIPRATPAGARLSRMILFINCNVGLKEEDCQAKLGSEFEIDRLW